MTTIPIPPEAVEAASSAYHKAIRLRDFEDSLRAALAAAAPMIVGAQWVSVKERMPDKLTGEGVLFLTWDGEFHGTEFVSYLRRGPVFFRGAQNRAVTHWMPLPPPPRIDPEAT